MAIAALLIGGWLILIFFDGIKVETTSNELEAIRSDPMTSYTPIGATQISIVEKVPANSLEPNNFIIERHFASDSIPLEQLEEQFVKEAENKGWIKSTPDEARGHYLYKELSTGSADLFVVKDNVSNFIVVSLTAH